MTDLSESLWLSRGEVSKSLKRLSSLLLISLAENESGRRYNLLRKNMEEFLVSGIRYVFQAEKGGLARGMPTGWSAPVIKSEIIPPEMPMVWAVTGGDVMGESVEPLYPGAIRAAQIDNTLYRLLALIDVIRLGKPRELAVAKTQLSELIKELC